MKDFEVRLYRADGALTIIMLTAANGLCEAEAAALDLLRGDIARGEIWQDEIRLTVVVPISRG